MIVLLKKEGQSSTSGRMGDLQGPFGAIRVCRGTREVGQRDNSQNHGALCVFTAPALSARQGGTGSWPSTGQRLKAPRSLPVFLCTSVPLSLCTSEMVLLCLCLSVRPEIGGSLRSQHVKHSNAGERSVLNLPSLLRTVAFSK